MSDLDYSKMKKITGKEAYQNAIKQLEDYEKEKEDIANNDPDVIWSRKQQKMEEEHEIFKLALEEILKMEAHSIHQIITIKSIARKALGG